MAELFINPARATDTDGNPLPGAKLYFYLTGTTTPTDVYTTNAMGTAHANPVVADSAGLFPSIYLNPAIDYRAVLKDASGATTVYDTDPVHKANEEVGTPEMFGCVAVEDGGGATDNTAAMEEALESGFRIEGRGKTYRVSALVVTAANVHADNLTLKEINPNTGDPVTVTFNAAVAGSGSLVLGRGFKVDRAGDGTAGTLNVSAGIKVSNFAVVQAECEVYGNAKGSGLLVEYARYFRDDSYIHDMFCSHSGVTDDIQHGSWARYCDNVVTGGLVRNLGSIDRTAAARDRYNRGRAYSGCRNVMLGGAVGPGVDQAYDVTGDAAGGNTCIKLNGAHASHPYSVGFKFANAVLGTTAACATVVSPGLCGAMVSGPTTELANMTQQAIISGIVQLGGGENGVWSDVCVVKLDRNDASAPGRGFPRGVTVTGNNFMPNTGADTFTVYDTDELTPGLAAALNIYTGARVRLTTTGTLPTGLATATDYFASLSEGSRIRLSSSYANAIDKVYISGYAGGSGTHTITVQNDVDWGVYSNVDVYDATQPNLVYGNRFGTLTHRNTTVQDLKATAARGAVQTIADVTTAYVTGTSETDSYGICNLTGGSGSSTIFTIPMDGVYTLVLSGLWSGGAGTGSAQCALQADSGGGFADIGSAAQVSAFTTANFTQSIHWTGYLTRNTVIRGRLYHNDGAPRDFTLRDFSVEYVPG
jgi:hypothetical protein